MLRACPICLPTCLHPFCIPSEILLHAFSPIQLFASEHVQSACPSACLPDCLPVYLLFASRLKSCLPSRLFSYLPQSMPNLPAYLTAFLPASSLLLICNTACLLSSHLFTYRASEHAQSACHLSASPLKSCLPSRLFSYLSQSMPNLPSSFLHPIWNPASLFTYSAFGPQSMPNLPASFLHPLWNPACLLTNSPICLGACQICLPPFCIPSEILPAFSPIQLSGLRACPIC